MVIIMETTSIKTKSKVEYSIVESQTVCDENQKVLVYGIRISKCGKEMQLQDISTDKQKIESFLHKIKRLKVMPEFLKEVAEDFLGDTVMGEHKDRGADSLE